MSVAIITGASRGLGEALARGLADAGWRLVIDARGAGDLNRVAAELSASTEAVAIPGDITASSHRADLIDAARRLGGLDLIVNNAGTLGPSPLPRLADFPLDGLRHIFEVNVIAQLALVQDALPLLRTGHASVLNITSDAGVEAYEGWGGYGAAKAAFEQLSRVLAAEEPSLRVWWVDPGDMRTRMHQDAFPGEDISDRPEPSAVVPSLLRLIWEQPPSGRYRAADSPVGAMATETATRPASNGGPPDSARIESAAIAIVGIEVSR
jgi:NAD(P)-dependent dehydrogenase (short-subunit alcohol dehydrogenase family)